MATMATTWTRSLLLSVSTLLAACSAASPSTSSNAADVTDKASSASPSLDGGSPDPSPTNSANGASTPVPSCTTDLTPELANLHVPGLSAGIIKNGKLVCTAVAGLANIEENRPITPDTIFVWASVSKTVTAVTLMTLFEQGGFKLDDPINPQLPFQVTVPTCAQTPITFRQLFTHTSSIKETDDGFYDSSYGTGDSPIALGDFLKSYLVLGGSSYSATGNFEAGCPGTINEYSNVGAGMLGYLGERISKTPFDELALARIFKPLLMNETSFRLKAFDPTHLAMPYELEGTKFTAVGQFGFPTYPDGLLRTSVPQLARFLLMFSNFGELDGTRILSRETVEEMRRVQIPLLDDTQGLIWYYDEIGGRHVLGHNGSDDGVTANMFFDPADGSGVLLVANGEWEDALGDALTGKLFDEAKAY